MKSGISAFWMAWSVGAAAVSLDAAVISVPAAQPTIAAAIGVANPGDIVDVTSPSLFGSELVIDYLGKAITVQTASSIDQPIGGQYRLAPGSALQSISGSISIRGELRSPATGAADVRGTLIVRNGTGRVTVQRGSRLNVASTSSVIRIESDAGVRIESDATLMLGGAFSGSPQVDNAGRITLQPRSYLACLSGLRNSLGLFAGIISDNATIEVNVRFENDSAVTLLGGSLYLAGDYEQLSGSARLVGQGTSILSTGLVRAAGGEFRLTDAGLLADTLELLGGADATLINTDLTLADRFRCSAETTGSGYWIANLENSGTMYMVDNTSLVGNAVNNGTIRVQRGTLSIFGTLSGSGTIIGSVSGPTLSDGDTGGGLEVGGNCSISAGGGLLMPSPLLTVAIDGNFDCAINDPARFDMRAATLKLSSVTGDAQLERMSLDRGPRASGLDPLLPGNFPIGTLNIARGRVALVDNHNNPGALASCDAVYADTLIIAAGATLITNGCPVYYRTLTNLGTIDVPGAVVQIPTATPGDMNCDGSVNFSDIEGFVLALASRSGYEAAFPKCEYLSGDVNFDGSVDFDDINAFVGCLVAGECL